MSKMGEADERTGSIKEFRYYTRANLESFGVENLGSTCNENRISRDIYRFNSDVGELWINLSGEASDRYQVVNILKEEEKDGEGR